MLYPFTSYLYIGQKIHGLFLLPYTTVQISYIYCKTRAENIFSSESKNHFRS